MTARWWRFRNPHVDSFDEEKQHEMAELVAISEGLGAR
jgi:hypothetical protein